MRELQRRVNQSARLPDEKVCTHQVLETLHNPFTAAPPCILITNNTDHSELRTDTQQRPLARYPGCRLALLHLGGDGRGGSVCDTRGRGETLL